MVRCSRCEWWIQTLDVQPCVEIETRERSADQPGGPLRVLSGDRPPFYCHPAFACDDILRGPTANQADVECRERRIERTIFPGCEFFRDAFQPGNYSRGIGNCGSSVSGKCAMRLLTAHDDLGNGVPLP